MDGVTVSVLGALVALAVAIVLILKKVQPTYAMIFGAVIGGLVGGASSFIGYSDFSGSIVEAALLIVNMVSPWAVIILGVLSFIVCWVIYRKARAMYEGALTSAKGTG